MKYLSLLAVMASTGTAYADDLRVATFNASLNRRAAGELAADIAAGDNMQMQKIAQILADVDPDILLINEFDYGDGLAAQFNETYLGGQFSHVFVAPSNTGLPSGLDLDGNGTVVAAPGSPQYANDSYGFGFYPGQYGMAVFSKYDIVDDDVRTFQDFKWADMPNARRPINADGTPFYADAVWTELRLSSKSHWDVPISVDGTIVHFLTSHPTPPVFDGPEDKNGTRNADEIRFWADYIAGADYMTDDHGHAGGLAHGAHFVIAGDLNADPKDGDSTDDAAQQLLGSDLVNTALTPTSEGAQEASALQGGANAAHLSDPSWDTTDWNDEGPGNLRADYVLPSATLTMQDAGVYWPKSDTPEAALIDVSDHRLVWVDVKMP